jgi:hypothetical protein
MNVAWSRVGQLGMTELNAGRTRRAIVEYTRRLTLRR